MFFSRCFLIIFFFASCRSSKFFEVRPPLTTFEGDSSLFKEVNNPRIDYEDQLGVISLSNILKPNKKVSVIINKPTLVQCISSNYIVYPRDNIKVMINQYGELIFHAIGNEARTRELYFQNVFQNLNRKIRPQFPNRTKDYTIDTVLLFEQNVKSETPAYINRSRTLFDSLAGIYKISDTFKMLAETILENERFSTLNYFYNVYDHTFKTNNLYLQKQRELLPVFNNIKNKHVIYLGASYYIVSIAQNITGKKIRMIKSEDEVKETIDSINSNFKNLSRDFLLTKLFYNVIYKRVSISKETMQYYYRSCKDSEYKSIISKFEAERKKFSIKSKRKKDNRLIALTNSKIYTIEEIIAKHKRKLVLIDFWASWCAPCIKQMPYIEKLKHQFSKDKISFLNFSIDKEIIQWQQKVADIGLDPDYSYVFENFDKQSFLKNNYVETIPRYILIGQNGKIINADAPSPDNPALKKLIEEHLKNY